MSGFKKQLSTEDLALEKELEQLAITPSKSGGGEIIEVQSPKQFWYYVAGSGYTEVYGRNLPLVNLLFHLTEIFIPVIFIPIIFIPVIFFLVIGQVLAISFG
jgi:hypothetical protein